MRTKVTLVLVFLNVALFFFIFKFERAWRTDDQLREVRRLVLPGPEAADIRTLEVSGPGGQVLFSLARDPVRDTWKLTKPLDWPANPNAANGIVQALRLLEHETSFSAADLAKNGMSLANYGLDKPRLTVAFTSGDPATAAPASTLKIGDTTGNRLYVLSPDGDRIHVVNRALADTLALSLDQLRADALFTIPVFEAHSLSVRTGGSDPTRATAGVPIRVRRDGARWTFETPFSGRGSKTDIDIAISGLDRLRAKTFDPPNPPATRPAAAPTLRITLEGTNRSETLYLGEPVPLPPGAKPDPGADIEYYAQFEGSEQIGRPRAALFTVAMPTQPVSLLDTLRNAPVNLRDRHVLDFEPRTVTAITLGAPVLLGQPALTLQRIDGTGPTGDGEWQVVRRGDAAQTSPALPADRAAVQRLLDQLRLLSAKNPGGFVSDAPAASDIESKGFNRPEREITLTVADPPGPGKSGAKSTTIVLQLGTDEQHQVYARVDPVLNTPGGTVSVYAVAFDFEREVPLAPLAWRNRQLREPLPAAARLTALTLAPVADGATPIYSHSLAAGETWDAVLAAEPAPKKQAIAEVLAQLQALHAAQFLQEKFADRIAVAGEERPWKYRLDATVALPGGAGGEQTSTLTLFLTERVGGAQQYAGSKELDVVYAIDQPFLDALRELVYGPRDPGPPPVPGGAPKN